MNDQPPNDDSQTGPVNGRQARMERREARRLARAGSGGGGALLLGLILILLGAAYLFQELGTFSLPLDNWWALFILIPTVGSFSRGLRIYRSAGNQWTRRARGAIFFGVILAFVTITFLLNLNWSIWGPVLLILAGIFILINTVIPSGTE